MNNIEAIDNRNKREKPPSKGTWTTDVNIITISGPSGTGKSTLAQYLSEWFQDLDSEKIGGGKFFRGSGKEYVGFVERSEQTDREADEYTEELISNTINSGKHLIIEGRLAGWVATKVKNRLPQDPQNPKIIRILIDAEDNVRFQRINDRENNRRKRRGELPILLATDGQATIERENGDNGHWHRVHPDMKGNPMDSKDEATKELYDLVIDATNLSVREVGATILRFFLENNLADIKFDKKEPDRKQDRLALPEETVIFESGSNSEIAYQ